MNVCRIYEDILIGEKLSKIQVTRMCIAYWIVLLSSRRGGDWVRGIDGEVLLLQPATSFTLLEYRIIWCKIPSNNTSIAIIHCSLFRVSVELCCNNRCQQLWSAYTTQGQTRVSTFPTGPTLPWSSGRNRSFFF